MNKELNVVLKTIIFSVVIYIEQYFFYKTILCNMITKRSIDMWITFILGSLILACVNTISVLILMNKNKLKPNSVVILIVSSVLISLFIMILSLCNDKDLLREINYSHEISYLVLFVLSILVTVWTVISNVICKLFVNFKH